MCRASESNDEVRCRHYNESTPPVAPNERALLSSESAVVPKFMCRIPVVSPTIALMQNPREQPIGDAASRRFRRPDNVNIAVSAATSRLRCSQ